MKIDLEFGKKATLVHFGEKATMDATIHADREFPTSHEQLRELVCEELKHKNEKLKSDIILLNQ